MTASKENVIEPHARQLTGAVLYINTDASWSVGLNTNKLVKVTFADITSINDDTFGYSAVAVEPDGKGGYRLFVRSDANNDAIVEVAVNAAGKVDPASVTALTKAQMYAVETQYKLDLNDNGGFGDHPVLLQGGAINLYEDALGDYQIGTGVNALKTLTVGGQLLTDEVLPAGWKIIDVEPSGNNYTVYAKSGTGDIYAADFTSAGVYTGGKVLTAAELNALETAQGIDINGDSSLPAPAGWTSAIKDPALKQAIDGALSADISRPLSVTGEQATPKASAGGAGITHAELVKLMQDMISTHKTAGNTPITADEMTSLQAMASRGKAVFTGATDSAADYLAFIFSKLVNGSDANRFFTAGAAQRSELGSLTVGSSVLQLEKLVDKWLLGGDLPNPSTGGDSATGKAQSVTAVYAKSSGALFVDGVSLPDVSQGSAGDCYLIAVFAGLAGTKPQTIQSMVVENPAVNGVRSWGVRFIDSTGTANWQTVNDMLPTRPDDPTKLAYAGSASKDLNGEIWVPLIEKAYAQANMLGILPRAESTGQNSYGAVEGGNGEPLSQLIVGKSTQYTVTTDPSKVGAAVLNGFVNYSGVNGNDPAAMAALAQILKNASNAGKMIWVGVTTTVKDSFGNSLLVGSHAHYALDAAPTDPNNDTLLVYNPWGLKDLTTPAGQTTGEFISPAPYTVSQLIGIPGLDFVILDGMGG